MSGNSTTKVVFNSSRPPTLVIRREGTYWRVGYHKVPDLGYSTVTAGQKRDEFAQILLGVGAQITAKVDFDLPEELPDSVDEIMTRLTPALEFEPDDLSEEMKKLRDIGLFLYNELSKDMKVALKKSRVHAGYTEADADPPITVFMDSDSDNARAPICWNMIFQEDKQPETISDEFQPPKLMEENQIDWRNFWGFRIPISQFLNNFPDRRQIKISTAFTAVDDGLQFPNLEKCLLSRFVTESIDMHQCLHDFASTSLKEYGIVDSMEDAADWMKKHRKNQDGWLDVFLNEIVIQQAYADETKRKAAKQKWADTALRKILAGPKTYDLIHFACHCYLDSAGTEDVSLKNRRLQLGVAGRQISIPHGYITNFLRRTENKEDWYPDSPGPFVFLNACASSKQDKQEQFPELPAEWIEWQGAKAVIATICDVPDVFAFAFALKLYQNLFSPKQENIRLDEALLKTRRYFMDKFNNPMGLAYELYALDDTILVSTISTVRSSQ